MSPTVLYDSIDWSTSRWPKFKCNLVVFLFGHCYFYPPDVCSRRGLTSNVCVASFLPNNSYFNNSYFRDVSGLLFITMSCDTHTTSIWLRHHIIILFIEYYHEPKINYLIAIGVNLQIQYAWPSLRFVWPRVVYKLRRGLIFVERNQYDLPSTWQNKSEDSAQHLVSSRFDLCLRVCDRKYYVCNYNQRRIRRGFFWGVVKFRFCTRETNN